MIQTAESIAEKAKNASETAAATVQNFAKDLSAKAKELGEQSMKTLTETGEFNKANAMAIVESGKITGRGMQDISKNNVDFAKKSVEEYSAAIKRLSTVKSPAEFFQLQSELVRKQLDDVVAQSSKNVEAVLNLTNEAFQPISSRMALAAEKIKISA